MLISDLLSPEKIHCDIHISSKKRLLEVISEELARNTKNPYAHLELKEGDEVWIKAKVTDVGFSFGDMLNRRPHHYIGVRPMVKSNGPIDTILYPKASNIKR